MLKPLRHLLLVGVLFGLAGNGVAAASAPCVMMTMQHRAAMADMPDCDMAVPCPDCVSKHGKGMKPSCAMTSGCTSTLAMRDLTPATTSPRIAPIAEFWPVATVLAGRNVTPEPKPPSHLG